MRYMIIERFHKGKIKTLYDRFDKKGRLMPDGIQYINSWIDENVEICYQVMESPSIDLLYEWIDNWKDLCDFEVIPVIDSAEARRRVLG